MKTVFLGLPVLALAAAAPAFAQQENARVISSVPVIQQVAVPQQVCTQQPVVTSSPNTGAGAIMGAIAGGAMGNAVGHGSGRAAATALGLIGGAVLGNNVEGPGRDYVQNVQSCSTQTTYENRTVGYNVTYEYAGRQYTVQMASDPGAYVPVQVAPLAGGAQSAPVYSSNTGPVYSPSAAAPVYGTSTPAAPSDAPVTVQRGVVVSAAAPVVYRSTTYVQPPVYAAPVYAAPVYAAPYPVYGYPPVGLSLNFGYSSWHGHGRRW